MITATGRVASGAFGDAVEINVVLDPEADPPDWQAGVATWFITAPGWSPLFQHYVMYVIHLRPIAGVKPAVLRFPGATHEITVHGLDEREHPVPTSLSTWSIVVPANVSEQVTLPDDDAADQLAALAAQAIVDGILPPEVPLSGQREPWRTAMIKTSAHLRGEEHSR